MAGRARPPCVACNPQVAACLGKEGDATPFTTVTVDNISAALHRWDYNRLCLQGLHQALWTACTWELESICQCNMACLHPLCSCLAPADSSGIAALLLRRCGYQSRGWEVMYNGHTGRQLQAQIFLNPTYYQRLKHMVDDKIHSRCSGMCEVGAGWGQGWGAGPGASLAPAAAAGNTASSHLFCFFRGRGPVQILTRQPVEGRARDGGLRFGEMERDCIISHGAAAFLKERLFDQSDAYRVHICSSCGLIAVANLKKNQFYCTACKNTTGIVQVGPEALLVLRSQLVGA